jgi:hypothetical protein
MPGVCSRTFRPALDKLSVINTRCTVQYFARKKESRWTGKRTDRRCILSKIAAASSSNPLLPLRNCGVLGASPANHKTPAESSRPAVRNRGICSEEREHVGVFLFRKRKIRVDFACKPTWSCSWLDQSYSRMSAVRWNQASSSTPASRCTRAASKSVSPVSACRSAAEP